MKCPKCQGELEVKHFGAQIALRRCVKCLGIWCEGQDLAHLREVPMIDVLDIGDASRGAVFNRIAQVLCPSCGDPLTEERVYDQPHIAIDVCKGCSGIFLDAGELTDIKHITFGDWLKAMQIKLHLV